MSKSVLGLFKKADIDFSNLMKNTNWGNVGRNVGYGGGIGALLGGGSALLSHPEDETPEERNKRILNQALGGAAYGAVGGAGISPFLKDTAKPAPAAKQNIYDTAPFHALATATKSPELAGLGVGYFARKNQADLLKKIYEQRDKIKEEPGLTDEQARQALAIDRAGGNANDIRSHILGLSNNQINDPELTKNISTGARNIMDPEDVEKFIAANKIGPSGENWTTNALNKLRYSKNPNMAAFKYGIPAGIATWAANRALNGIGTSNYAQ